MFSERKLLISEKSTSFVDEFHKFLEAIDRLIERYGLFGSKVEKTAKSVSNEIIDSRYQGIPVRDLVEDFVRELGENIPVSVRNAVIENRHYRNIEKAYKRFEKRDFSFYGRFLEDLRILLSKFNPEELRVIVRRDPFRFIDKMKKEIRKVRETTSAQTVTSELTNLAYDAKEFPYKLELSITEAIEEIGDRLLKLL